MKAVIMAGGFGTRIQPLTGSMPKPMFPLFRYRGARVLHGARNRIRVRGLAN